MLRRWLVVGLLFAPIALLTSGPAALESSPFPPAGTAVLVPSHPDTLRATVTKGEPLVRSLPAELDGAPVTRYALIQGPSLSGVAGQSFAWIPHEADPGPHTVQLEAQHPDTRPDTLVLRIEVQ